MTPQPIPDEHNVSRVVKNSQVDKDLTGKRQVADIEAFRLREHDTYLSVNWLEYFQGSQRERLDQVRETLIRKRFDVKHNTFFAIVNVNDIKTAGRYNNYELSVVTIGDRRDPSHSGIYGLPRNPEDDIVLQIIAQHATVENAWR